nr:MAG TPA: SAM-dependent methyltransferases related to tRNA (uracil-5-)-methyltransferase [Bacteriophage sp.]
MVYISCKPTSLARDLQIFMARGYRVEKICCVDMFPNTYHVETCVLLSKLKSTPHIEVDIELDEMDLSKAESKATYAEITQYVLENTGLNVSRLYIAQVKRKHGLIERINYNVGDGKSRVPQVTPEKEKAIEDALRHFQMI